MENKGNRWIKLDEEYCRFKFHECGHRRVDTNDCNHCPNCGASMIEDLQSCSCGNNGKCNGTCHRKGK